MSYFVTIMVQHTLRCISFCCVALLLLTGFRLVRVSVHDETNGYTIELDLNDRGDSPQEPMARPETIIASTPRALEKQTESITLEVTPEYGVESTFSTGSPLDVLKVPYPIFVASLPKSGTTTVARYFYCGNIWTAHTFVNTNVVGTYPTDLTLTADNTNSWPAQMKVGECYQENVLAGRPPFQYCGRYKVWSDAGHPGGKPCYYPSVHGLEEFYDAYPNGTILLVTRNATKWTASVNRWKQKSLLKRWKRCDKFPSNGVDTTEEELIDFYNWHAQSIRDFAASHPSIHYIEAELEDPLIGELFEEKIGVNASCFGHHNSHEKRLAKNPKFRKQYMAAVAQEKKKQQTKI